MTARLLKLCEAAVNEPDPDKRQPIVREIDELIDKLAAETLRHAEPTR